MTMEIELKNQIVRPQHNLRSSHFLPVFTNAWLLIGETQQLQNMVVEVLGRKRFAQQNRSINFVINTTT